MKILQKLFRYLLTGTFFLLPFVITIGLLWWIGYYVAKFLGPSTLVGGWLKAIGYYAFKQEYPLLAWLLGLLSILAFIMIIGFIVERRFIKNLVKWIKDTTKKIPAIGTLYGAILKLVEIFQKKDDATTEGMTPVYCRFGGTIIMALLTAPEKFIINGKSFYSVIIPTAPVPVGGAVIMVPEEDVIFTELKREHFISFYGTMGATGSDFIPTEDGDIPVKNEGSAITESTADDEQNAKSDEPAPENKETNAPSKPATGNNNNNKNNNNRKSKRRR